MASKPLQVSISHIQCIQKTPRLNDAVWQNPVLFYMCQIKFWNLNYNWPRPLFLFSQSLKQVRNYNAHLKIKTHQTPIRKSAMAQSFLEPNNTQNAFHKFCDNHVFLFPKKPTLPVRRDLSFLRTSAHHINFRFILNSLMVAGDRTSNKRIVPILPPWSILGLPKPYMIVTLKLPNGDFLYDD